MYLYIHIPFCASKCIYCDFYSKTNTQDIEDYLTCLKREIGLRSNRSDQLDTIYLGGGTPSLLSPKQLGGIFDCLNSSFDLSSLKEVTIEMNPDDVTNEYLDGIASLPINRISMGVQSWYDDDLKFLRRRHTSDRAMSAVKMCQDKGYSRLSLDLIYGLPNQTIERWKHNIMTTLDLDPGHISAYHLIYEEGTPLNNLRLKGRVSPIDEELSLEQFELLISLMSDGGYEQYEISNFAKNEAYAIHNTSYWLGLPYMGFGPAAHSYDGIDCRRSNYSDLRRYIDCLLEGQDAPHDNEYLTQVNRHDEMIMCSLRTKWGLDLSRYESLFGRRAEILRQSQSFIDQHLLQVRNDHLILTRKGIFLSDGIMSELFL